MFGFVTANLEDLTPEEKNRYKAAYCGLCHSIGEKHGFLARMGLTYDLTFVALLLSSLYEPQERCGECRCVVHPCKKHSYAINRYTEYAADMTVALMYHKCLDDWNDDKNLSRKCYASMLSKAYEQVKQQWPVQCEIIEKELAVISEIEKDVSPNPDGAANSFGRLMSGVLVVEDDHWKPYLQKIGYGLGRYIYFADAAVDLRDDIKKNSYNPLISLSVKPEDMRPALKVMLGEASEAFEALPLLQDIRLLRNILYSGVWIKYNQGMQKERKKAKNGK